LTSHNSHIGLAVVFSRKHGRAGLHGGSEEKTVSVTAKQVVLLCTTVCTAMIHSIKPGSPDLLRACDAGILNGMISAAAGLAVLVSGLPTCDDGAGAVRYVSSRQGAVRMVVGMMDNTCIYEVVEALSSNGPAKCHLWAWKSAVEVTCVIVGSQHLRLAPSPTRDGLPSGQFGQLLLGLSEFVQTAEAAPAAAKSAKQATKRWLRDHPGRVAETYRVTARSAEFRAWLDWFTRNVWEEHASRLGGLFDPDFIPQMVPILELPRGDLEKLWHISNDSPAVARLARRQPDTPTFRSLQDAYVVSALIRGKYHDYVARKSGWQIMHHPLRATLLPAWGNRAGQEYPISGTEAYFANIILGSAYSHPRRNRLNEWTTNVLAARCAWRAGIIDLRPKLTDDIALAAAVRAARQLDVPCHSRTLDRALEVAASLGVGGLSSFTLTGWESLAAAGGTAVIAYLAKDKEPSRRAISVITRRGGRLQALAKAGPGRIDRLWLPRRS
jgi:hypothetical protein